MNLELPEISLAGLPGRSVPPQKLAGLGQIVLREDVTAVAPPSGSGPSTRRSSVLDARADQARAAANWSRFRGSRWRRNLV